MALLAADGKICAGVFGGERKPLWRALVLHQRCGLAPDVNLFSVADGSAVFAGL